MSKIEIRLGNNIGIISPKDIINLTKNETVSLSFILPEMYDKKQKYMITLKNGSKKLSYSINTTSYDIPNEFLIAGKLYVSFSIIAGGKAVKTWTCEPLILKEPDVSTEDWLEISPMISDMQRKIDTQNSKLELQAKAILEIQTYIDKKGEIL